MQKRKTFFELLKRYKYNSVLVKTFLLVIGLEIAVMGVLNAIYYYRIEKNIYREVEESCIQEVKRQGTLLDTMVDQIISFSFYTTYNNDYDLTIFTIPNNNQSYEEGVLEQLTAGIKAFQKSFEYIESTYIYLEGLDGIITKNGIEDVQDLKDTEWIDRYEVFRNTPYYTIESRSVHGKYPYLLTVYYPVYRGGFSSGKAGMVVVNINMDRLSDMLGYSFKDMRKIYMTGENGEILFTNDTKLLKELSGNTPVLPERTEASFVEFEIWEFNGEETATAMIRSSYGNWYYSMDFDMDYYGDRFDDTRNFLLWSAIVSLVMGLLLSVILAIRSYRPLRYTIGLLESDEELVEDILEDAENQDELRHIFELTHRIPKEGAGVNIRSEEWMERLGKAQMHVLQSQITPHFLYNTLDAINWMAVDEVGRDNQVSAAIQDLAKLLRMSMNKTSYFATLQEEMEQAKLYIQVMEIQNPGKIKVYWEISEQLYDWKVVRFTLQPLLENSIRHGFAHRRYRGNIYVKADAVEDLLMIKISDDGCGMSVEECRRLNERLASEYEIVNKHVGVQNVNQRIKIMFGEEFGLRVIPGDEEGVIIYMAFPHMT